jgi:hypothetical protein
MSMIALRRAELFRIELRLRMPFRYGIATLTELPHALLRLTFEIDGQPQHGFAADNLPPKWFTKDAARLPADEITEMFDVIRAAVRHAEALHAATPFAFWRELWAAQAGWGKTRNLPPLLTHFGTSFVERALLDAFCRARGTTLAHALRDNLAGIELGALHSPLAGSAPRDWLPAAPVAGAFARHTVGLSDPLDESELAPGDRVGDGLPQTLLECIRAYQLRHFKIKINGEAARDRARLTRMASLFAQECAGDYAFSLDGNESFRDVGSFADYMRALMAEPHLRTLWPHLLFIEQPWHRDVALSPAMAQLAAAWPERPPIIIDESDAELHSTATALELGYAGTSHKNCKGVFKSVANACLLAQRRAAGESVMLSGEDLTNLGPVALTQDLAAAAALGITTIERNGHHYFAGLSQFSPALQAHVLAHHGDLFTRGTQGWPLVDVRHGRVALGTVNAAPFGVAGDLDVSGLTREPLSL